MDANKRQRYEKVSAELTRLSGGKENIQGVAHCATRLRIVLKDNDLADLKAMEDVDLAKGVFVAGDQVQIIFGAGLVNDVYEVFAETNNMKNMSLSDLKTVANQKMNPLQRVIKALSDVFVDIMPGILAAALLTGLSGVLGNMDFVKANETLSGINTLINIASGAIFGVIGGLLYAVAINRGRLEDLSTRQMVMLAAFSLYHGFTSKGVNNVAHLAGLVLGVVMGAVLYRKPKRRTGWMEENIW